MPNYWVKNYFTHGRFPKVGQKQKMEREKKKKRKDKRLNNGNNNGQATHGTQAAWANYHDPCMDTSRNYNDWSRSNHTGILKQHSQELQNFGSSTSINNLTNLDNHNRYDYGMDSSRYRRFTDEDSSSSNVHRYFESII